MTGQDAVATAEAFHEALELDGVILTKLDGDARGGAALSVKKVVGTPDRLRLDRRAPRGLRACSTPTAWPSRILGMGDVLTLIERAERELDEDVDRAGPMQALRAGGSPSRTSTTSSSR